MSEKYPHSIPGWITYIKGNGVSDRPFAKDDSDLINPDTYADPLDTKPERAALASIIAIRAYQRTKKQMLSHRNVLCQPAIDSIQRERHSFREQIEAFKQKSWKIGMAFDTGMEEGLQEDERFILAHQDHPAARVYFRLKSIVDPHIPGQESRSSVFHDVYSGVGALPGTMQPLMEHLAETYLKKHKELPSLRKLAELMEGSYDTYVEPLASLHKADGDAVIKLLRSAAERAYIHTFVQLNRSERRRAAGKLAGETPINKFVRLIDSGLQLDAQVTKAIRRIESTGDKPRSRTTRCAFLTSAKSIEMFLDEPPDFDDPLRDAFRLYMSLLAA